MPTASTQLACSAGTRDVDAQRTLLTALYPTRAKHAGVGIPSIPTCPLCSGRGSAIQDALPVWDSLNESVCN